MSKEEDNKRVILRQEVSGTRLLARASDGMLWLSYQMGLNANRKDNIFVPVFSMGDACPMDWQEDPESGSSVEVELLPNLVRLAWPEMNAEVRAEMRRAVDQCDAETCKKILEAEEGK